MSSVEAVRRALRPDVLGATETLIDGALGAASAADGRRAVGSSLGPLDGVPFAVKANIDVIGVPTTSGTALARPPAAADAAAVAAWRAAGLVPVRTTTLAELAIGSVTDNAHTGPCRNPHDARLAAGGSSGGSGALVGAGLVPLALGSDTMGSVRIPAAYCGVVGYKPSRRAVDARGLTPLHPLLDTVGVIAAAPEQLRLAVSLLLARDADQEIRPLRRVAVVDDLTAVADDAGRAAVAASAGTLSDVGWPVGSVRLDLDLGMVRRRGLLVCEAETYRRFAAEVDTDDPGLSDRVRTMLRYGRDAGEQRLQAALATLADIRGQALKAFTHADVLIAPTTPAGPPLVGEEPADAADLTAWVNVAGACAVSVPAGAPAPDGIRRGVQLIARPGADRALLDLAEDLGRVGAS